MKFELFGLNNYEKIKLPQPVWFEHEIGLFGTKISFNFTFTKPVSFNINKIEIKNSENYDGIYIIDRIQQTINEKNNVFNVVISHPLCYVWQNYVEPKQFNSLSVNDVFENFCKPFGIKSIKSSLLNSKPTPFFTTLGMTNFDVIQLFFKKEFNCSVFVDENKNLTPKFESKKMSVLNLNKCNLKHYCEIDNRTKLLSTIFVQQFNDLPNKFTVFKQTSTIAYEKNIERVKFFKVPQQFSLLPNKGAQVLLEKQNANHKILEVKLAKFLPPIWPGSLIKLKINSKTMNVCVDYFKTEISKTGPQTTLLFLFDELFI